jgi:hypothetical protein
MSNGLVSSVGRAAQNKRCVSRRFDSGTRPHENYGPASSVGRATLANTARLAGCASLVRVQCRSTTIGNS